MSGAGRDPSSATDRYSSRPTDSDVTTGNDPTTSADPHTEDTAQGMGAGSQREGGEGAGLEQTASKNESKRENPSAIPTAGGEQLGKQHWGESKIVPDNPPRRESEGNKVSSAAGQGDRK